MSGRSLDEYGSPLFLAWQLTNRLRGPLPRLLRGIRAGQGLARRTGPRRGARIWPMQTIALGIPYVAFGGGEPLGVPLCWDIFERLAAAGVAIKLETNGRHIDDAAARPSGRAGVAVHPDLGGWRDAPRRTSASAPAPASPPRLAAIDRLVGARHRRRNGVFVPTRLNIHEIVPAYEMAVQHGCSAFVTGPLMRLGRAAAAWDRLACDDAAWDDAAMALRATRRGAGRRHSLLSIYPWDILTELERAARKPAGDAAGGAERHA